MADEPPFRQPSDGPLPVASEQPPRTLDYDSTEHSRPAPGRVVRYVDVSTSAKIGIQLVGVVGGVGYAVLALACSIYSIYFIAQQPISNGWFAFPATALIVPAAISLRFRPWRGFAVGIFLVLGFALLIAGLCASDHSLRGV